ncbi:hypothetical protein ACQ86N_32180 [Puia sp. P3]|uniref:hypothetical protein n=1 Tax=Puia sp. P3 TaxID=3423952 RepID=UPI003D66F954
MAFGNAGEFVLVFFVDLIPEHFFYGFMVEGPVFSGIMGEEVLHGFDEVVDLGGEEVAVLEADVFWGALEVDVDPACAVVAGGFDEAGVGGGMASAGCWRFAREWRFARAWWRRTAGLCRVQLIFS